MKWKKKNKTPQNQICEIQALFSFMVSNSPVSEYTTTGYKKVLTVHSMFVHCKQFCQIATYITQVLLLAQQWHPVEFIIMIFFLLSLFFIQGERTWVTHQPLILLTKDSRGSWYKSQRQPLTKTTSLYSVFGVEKCEASVNWMWNTVMNPNKRDPNPSTPLFFFFFVKPDVNFPKSWCLKI